MLPIMAPHRSKGKGNAIISCCNASLGRYNGHGERVLFLFLIRAIA
jgi:hypothetical protein